MAVPVPTGAGLGPVWRAGVADIGDSGVVYSSGSQPGWLCPLGGHWVMSRDYLACQYFSGEEGGKHLQCLGQAQLTKSLALGHLGH